MGQKFKAKVARKFRYSGWVKELQSLTGTKLTPKEWVFIVGCYNSGTTLLEELIARHPLTSTLEDEGTVLTGYLNRPEDYGWTRMWAECEAQVSMGAEVPARIADNIKRHWSHFYDHATDRVLIEKSIVNATRIPFFAAHFTPAYFIYIRRNGYAVVEGIRRKATPGDYPEQHFAERYPYSLCAKQWQRSAELIETELAKVDHRLDVSYEDLCADPAALLDCVADFLELPPFPPEVGEGQMNIHGLKSAIINQNAKSIARLSPAELQEINAVAAPFLKQYGYYKPGA